MSVAAVILAAGASLRLGRPKQTVVLAGETLVARAVRTAKAAGLAPVIVVVADDALAGPLKALGAEVLLNRRAFDGMSTSIVIGVGWAAGMGVDGVVLMTCDQVALTPDDLRSLCAQPELRTGSAYAGKTGIPAYFPARDMPALLALEGDMGARELLREARCVAGEALAFDVDTEADLDRARAMLEGQGGSDFVGRGQGRRSLRG